MAAAAEAFAAAAAVEAAASADGAAAVAEASAVRDQPANGSADAQHHFGLMLPAADLAQNMDPSCCSSEEQSASWDPRNGRVSNCSRSSFH